MLNLCNYISLSIDDFNQVKIDRRQSLDILTDWMTFPAQIRIGVGPTYAEDNVGTLEISSKSRGIIINDFLVTISTCPY